MRAVAKPLPVVGCPDAFDGFYVDVTVIGDDSKWVLAPGLCGVTGCWV